MAKQALFTGLRFYAIYYVLAGPVCRNLASETSYTPGLVFLLVAGGSSRTTVSDLLRPALYR
jgi:hypothetical protein